MEVPSAFINEIQYIPLDFFTEDFYTNRKEHIDKRLSEIKSSWSIYALHCFAIGVWESCSNKRSFIVKELIRDAEELIEIITCIGRECLSSLLDRLIKDFRQYHSGLPDLFVWNFEEKKVGSQETSKSSSVIKHFVYSVVLLKSRVKRTNSPQSKNYGWII